MPGGKSTRPPGGVPLYWTAANLVAPPPEPHRETGTLAVITVYTEKKGGTGQGFCAMHATAFTGIETGVSLAVQEAELRAKNGPPRLYLCWQAGCHRD